MVFSLRFRGGDEVMQPVHIPSTEIETRFFPYPKYKRKEEIQELIKCGAIKVTEKDKRFYYEALNSGKIDLNLLIAKPMPPDSIFKTMLANLQRVTLPVGAESTDYFDLFIKYKELQPQLFFTVDAFAGRVHSPVSNFHRHLRPLLLLDGVETTSLDVTTAQPLLLGKILTKAIGENEYSKWIEKGEDIYIMLQNKAGLTTRDEAKKRFFEILFSKPSKALSDLFGCSTWINWINTYKAANESKNPHSISKPHSNLAWLLQSTEVGIMKQIWCKLADVGITFLGVHDEIIIKKSDQEKARQIMTEVLAKEFVYFKISDKETPPKSKIPYEIVQLQKYYSDLELKNLIPIDKRQQIGELWQGVMNDYHTPQLQQHLTTLKQIII
ncbi:MAG: hypothetical protein H7325_12305 [Pedobacter sp.]|nr:hypothetical protein [Pedobacter sp.]